MKGDSEMAFFNKKKVEQDIEAVGAPKKFNLSSELAPIKNVVQFAIEQKNKLQSQESETIDGIDLINKSFEVVQEKHENITSSVEGLRDEFSNVKTITDSFDEIISKLLKTAEDSNEGMMKIDSSEDSVKDTIDAMQEVFDKFQQSFDDIQEKVNQINGFATQTNLLALNASIEAARAGEAGKGFAVVATQVNKLSQEIKSLVADIGNSMEELNNNNQSLQASLGDTKLAIDKSHDSITETQEVIGSIKTVADEVGEQSQQMTDLIDKCNEAVDTVNHNIDASTKYFTDVSDNIDDIRLMITKKGFMFEDMNNVLEQINPLVDKIVKESR